MPKYVEGDLVEISGIKFKVTKANTLWGCKECAIANTFCSQFFMLNFPNPCGETIGYNMYLKQIDENQKNLTEAELKELKNTTNESEWNAVCDKIKAAREGNYPPDWFIKILATGLISEISAKWGKEPLTLTEE